MPNIVIRCKSSAADGMGHLVRQLRLGALLCAKKNTLLYFIDDYPPAISATTQAGFEYRTGGATSGAFLRDCGLRADLVILDQQNNDAGYIRDLRPWTRRIASFEDLGSGRSEVDLLIDANLPVTEKVHPATGVKTLFGLDYVVLHPDFAAYHSRQRQFPSIQRVLITMGGTDPKRLTAPLMKSVVEHVPGVEVTVIIGPGFSKEPGLEGPCLGPVRVLNNVTDMAAELLQHETVICAGGITLHEAVAAGTPALVINQVPHQENKARYLDERGAAVNLGLAENYDPRRIVEFLKSSPEYLEEMSRRGKALIDGKGIFRVADELLSLLGGFETCP